MAKKLRDILTDESKWIKGSYAMSAQGNIVAVESRRAVRFCLVGAMLRSNNGPECEERLREAMKKIFPQFKRFITSFNDHPDTTFADVCAVIEKAGV